MNKIKSLLALGALLGVFAALASPSPVRATRVDIELRVYGGASSLLTCGWHTDGGGSPNSGLAIDWIMGTGTGRVLALIRLPQ